MSKLVKNDEKNYLNIISHSCIIINRSMIMLLWGFGVLILRLRNKSKDFKYDNQNERAIITNKKSY